MEPNRNIGEYRVIRLLGKGGMSEVYEAEHRRLGSRHAIKLFAYDKDVDGVRERFLAEGKLLARLSHPRIVRVTDEGIDGDSGRPYFVMDLVCDPEGKVRSLADFRAGEADEAQIAMWYDDMREGLAYIHGKGIVHRDLKLENVLVGPDGHVVLTDFGISKIGVAEDGGAVVDPVQTIIRLRDGKSPVMGSIGYMAPELEMGVAASPASDYYALGVVVFRLLTGLWCDPRTDVLGALETFDPAWREIIPKLLHAHPQGRECLSWRELKETATERQIMDAEQVAERWKRLVRWGVPVAAALVFVALAVAVAIHVSRPAEAVPPVMFEDIVKVPEDAPEEEKEDEITRSQFAAALPDAWVLIHGILDELREGKITWEKALSDIEKKAKRARQGDNSLFDGLEIEYDNPNGDVEALAILLEDAVGRMKKIGGMK